MLKYVLQLLVGVAILLLLVLKLATNLKDIGSMKFNVFLFVLSVLAYTALNITLSFRMYYLISKIGVNVNFSKILISHLGGMVIGDVTPGRGGYLITPKVIDKFTGCGVDKALAAIITPQGVEFVLKAVGALAAVAYLLFRVSLSREFYYAFLIAATVVFFGGIMFLVVAWSKEEKSRNLIEKIPYVKKFGSLIGDFKDSSVKIKKFLPQIVLLYFVGWVVSGLQWYLIGMSINIDLSFVDFFLLHPLITTLTFIPLTPAGLGIMESGSILVFYLLKVDPSTALIFSILARLSNIIGDLPGLTIFVKKLVN